MPAKLHAHPRRIKTVGFLLSVSIQSQCEWIHVNVSALFLVGKGLLWIFFCRALTEYISNYIAGTVRNITALEKRWGLMVVLARVLTLSVWQSLSEIQTSSTNRQPATSSTCLFRIGNWIIDSLNLYCLFRICIGSRQLVGGSLNLSVSNRQLNRQLATSCRLPIRWIYLVCFESATESATGNWIGNWLLGPVCS